MSIPATTIPVRLKDALLSGDLNTRFCVYRCVDGISSCQTLPAKQAAELLDSGEYFQCPTEAKDAATAVKDIVEDEPIEVIEEQDTAVHPSQMDKRTKEYKSWKVSQEGAAE